MISALGKAGRLHEALEMYGSMRSAGLAGDVFTLAALITACEKVPLAPRINGGKRLAGALVPGSKLVDCPHMLLAGIAVRQAEAGALVAA